MAAESHMHIYLFGFEFTVPAKNDSKDDSSPGADVLVARLVGDDFDVSFRAPASDWRNVPDLALLFEPPVAVSGDFAMAAIAVSEPHLCDSARHERTGVLRI